MDNDIRVLRTVRNTAWALARLMAVIGLCTVLIAVVTLTDPPGRVTIVNSLCAIVLTFAYLAVRNFRTIAREANERLAHAVVAEAAAEAAARAQVRSHRINRAARGGR